MLKYVVLNLAFGLCILGCDQPSSQSIDLNLKYFDLSQLVDSLIANTDTIRPVTKTIHINDIVETKQLDTYNIKSDLLEFSKKSIAHPKYIGKYEKSKKIAEEGLHIVEYKALDEDLSIRLLTVSYHDNNQIKSIDILEQKETALIKQRKTYSIYPSRGYVKTSCDSLALMGEKCKGYTITYR